LILWTLTKRNDIRDDNRNQSKTSTPAHTLDATSRDKDYEVTGGAAEDGTNGKDGNAGKQH
jgi:hypothetical protein